MSKPSRTAKKNENAVKRAFARIEERKQLELKASEIEKRKAQSRVDLARKSP